jgi:ABC-type branched-subunit amino acid transport system ATPase component
MFTTKLLMLDEFEPWAGTAYRAEMCSKYFAELRETSVALLLVKQNARHAPKR